jgi:hypothetical protein
VIPPALLFAQYCLGYLQSFVFPNYFSISVMNAVGIFMEIALNMQIALIVQSFLLCWFCQFMSMGNLGFVLLLIISLYKIFLNTVFIFFLLISTFSLLTKQWISLKEVFPNLPALGNVSYFCCISSIITMAKSTVSVFILKEWSPEKVGGEVASWEHSLCTMPIAILGTQ